MKSSCWLDESLSLTTNVLFQTIYQLLNDTTEWEIYTKPYLYFIICATFGLRYLIREELKGINKGNPAFFCQNNPVSRGVFVYRNTPDNPNFGGDFAPLHCQFYEKTGHRQPLDWKINNFRTGMFLFLTKLSTWWGQFSWKLLCNRIRSCALLLAIRVIQ